MILRNLAKKLLLRAFNTMRPNTMLTNTSKQNKDNGEDFYSRGYGDVAWTEVPPGDFIN